MSRAYTWVGLYVAVYGTYVVIQSSMMHNYHLDSILEGSVVSI